MTEIVLGEGHCWFQLHVHRDTFDHAEGRSPDHGSMLSATSMVEWSPEMASFAVLSLECEVIVESP